MLAKAPWVRACAPLTRTTAVGCWNCCLPGPRVGAPAGVAGGMPSSLRLIWAAASVLIGFCFAKAIVGREGAWDHRVGGKSEDKSCWRPPANWGPLVGRTLPNYSGRIRMTVVTLLSPWDAAHFSASVVQTMCVAKAVK